MKTFVIACLTVLLSAFQADAQSSDPYWNLKKEANADGFWVEVEIAGVNNLAMLDTGAGVTVVPLATLPEGLEPIGTQPYTTADGTAAEASKFLVTLNVDGCKVEDVEVTGIPFPPYILLGTPLLKRLEAKFDLKAANAMFVCPATGAVHTVTTPNVAVTTSALVN